METKHDTKRTGIVESTKMDKSITVRVTRRFPHPIYGKIISKSKKIMVHDETEKAKEGDTVEIVQSKPMSKRKSWRLSKIISRKTLS